MKETVPYLTTMLWPSFLTAVMLLFFWGDAQAQEYNGTTGLLHVPSAETDSAGTFRGGGTFLHRDFTPSKFANKKRYNTFGYYVGLTAWPWLEMSYAAILLKTRSQGNLNNEDRRVCVKLRPLKERSWWPSLAVGFDDVSFRMFKERDELGGYNNYFQDIYAVASKHFNLQGWELGTHLAYRYYPSDLNRDRRGIAGGLSMRPPFYEPLRGVVEWDGRGMNVGADVLLWRHLFAQAILVHGQGFTGGISYHYAIPY